MNYYPRSSKKCFKNCIIQSPEKTIECLLQGRSRQLGRYTNKGFFNADGLSIALLMFGLKVEQPSIFHILQNHDDNTE